MLGFSQNLNKIAFCFYFKEISLQSVYQFKVQFISLTEGTLVEMYSLSIALYKADAESQ